MSYINTLETEYDSMSFKSFRIMFALLWTQYTLMPFVGRILSAFPGIRVVAPYVVPGLIVIMACMSLPYFKKRIRPQDVFFYFVGLLIVICTITIYPKNAFYIKEDVFRILIGALPFFFVGIAYDHDAMKNDLYYLSLATVLLMLLYEFFFLSQNTDADYNMDAAYKTLPSVMYLIYWAFEKKRIRDWALVGLGVILSLAFGTRGVLLAIVVYIFLGTFFNFVSSKSAIRSIFFILLFVVAIYILFGTNFLISISARLTKAFGSIGFSTRIFDQMLSGEIGESATRQSIASVVIEKIGENPLGGYGIYADRVFIGYYVHNIFLELWCNFGVIIGTMIMAWFVFVPVRAEMLTKRRDIKNFLLLFICMVFTKLMLSGSYITEMYLYLMLGLGVGIVRNIRNGRLD